MKRKAYFPLTHTQIKTFTASSAAQEVSIDNAILGPIPERILIAFVKNTAFVGSASTNPFHFHHYDIINLVLFVNGVQKPSEPLTIDCSSTFGAHMITLEILTKDFYVLGFDLTPDRKADEEYISLPRQGSARIEARFKKPLPEHVDPFRLGLAQGRLQAEASSLELLVPVIPITRLPLAIGCHENVWV